MDKIWWYILSMAVSIEPISALKRAAELVKRVREKRQPLFITQNGRAKVVIQDVESYEQREEALAYLKLCLDGERAIAEGRSKDSTAFRKSVDRRVRELVEKIDNT